MAVGSFVPRAPAPRLASANCRYRRAGRDQGRVQVRYEVDTAAQAAQGDADVDRMIEDRVIPIYSEDDLVQALENAGDALVVLQVMADEVCDTGLLEPDDGWTPDQEEIRRKKLAKCSQIQDSFVRMAAAVPDVRFLAMLGTDMNAERAEFSERLGVTTFPTVIFFKNNRIVWSSSGSTSMEHHMKQGVLYFGRKAKANGADVDVTVSDLHTKADLHAFIAGDDGPELHVLMVTAPFCSPCVHVYPYVVTLAANFRGSLAFGRLGDDESVEVREMFESLNILEVPTFITFKDGVEVSRCVTGDKGTLIGHLFDVIGRFGISVPARG